MPSDRAADDKLITTGVAWDIVKQTCVLNKNLSNRGKPDGKQCIFWYTRIKI
jgi:hypothetical protein